MTFTVADSPGFSAGVATSSLLTFSGRPVRRMEPAGRATSSSLRIVTLTLVLSPAPKLTLAGAKLAQNGFSHSRPKVPTRISLSVLVS